MVMLTHISINKMIITLSSKQRGIRESYRTSAAIEDDSFTPNLGQEVKRNVAKLRESKDLLNGLGLRKTFATPDWRTTR